MISSSGLQCLSAPDAERHVQSLRRFDITEIGSEEWKDQREKIEALNVQSHANVQNKKGDFVLDAFLSFDQIPTLIHELITLRVWLHRLMPHTPFRNAFLRTPTAPLLYQHYETVLVNLLECILFAKEAVLAAGDELLELIDYAVSHCNWLVARPRHEIDEVDEPAASGADTGDADAEMERAHARRSRNFKFKCAIASVSILWSVVDKIGRDAAARDGLPLSVLHHLVEKHDTTLLMCGLIEARPWVRTHVTAAGPQLEKYVDGEWDPRADMLRLSTQEAHAWLTLHILLCDPTARAKYRWDEHRRDQILRVRRFLVETHVDQVPTLMELQRALDELVLSAPPARTDEAFKNLLIVEPVPAVLRRADRRDPGWSWARQAERAAAQMTDGDAVRRDAVRLSRIIDRMGLGGGGDAD
eukprot:TRINITY_DN44286_c0_g1_i1.p1 TRINITY_DN44286_c0_g1~~TRINITY_DN44286_c0_g1_i1.p1  ORF type:complete len:415 (+),score=79.03 TRINITY_DN44286_c0_g1_i1:159-1403(+)